MSSKHGEEATLDDLDEARPSDPQPADSLGELAAFLVATSRVSQRLQASTAFTDADIRVSDWLLLRAIKEHGPLSIVDAARHAGVARQKGQPLVTDLMAAGLVKASGADLKSKLLSLSSAGFDILRDVESALLASLSSDGEVPVKQIHSARKSAVRIAKILSPVKRAKSSGDAE